MSKSLEAISEFAKSGTGEGSRGGHVIGHTASGKPVYAGNKAPAAPQSSASSLAGHSKNIADHVNQHGSWSIDRDEYDDSGMSAAEHLKPLEAHGYQVEHVGKKGEWYRVTKQTEKSMDGLDALSAFAKSELGLPEGGPHEDLPEGTEVSRPEDGGKVAGLGKQTGSGDSAPGPAVGAPSVSEEKLSEDDNTVETQLDNEEPKELGKSMRNLPRHALEQSVAKQRAQKLAQLRKGEEEIQHQPAKPQRQAPAVVEKSVRQFDQGAESLFKYNDGLDQQAEELMKSDGMFQGPAPQLGFRTVARDTLLCKSCESPMSAMLTACPRCGAGCVGHQLVKSVTPAIVIDDTRPGPALRKSRVEADLVLPQGTTIVEE